MLSIPTIVISLKRSHSRRLNAKEQLKNCGVEFEIFDGVDGLRFDSPPNSYKESKVIRLLGHSLTPSEVGCFLSHREVWLKCIEKDQIMLVLEDDFKLLPSFNAAISFLLRNQAQWDIVRLQGLADVPHHIIKHENELTLVMNNSDPLGATSYLLKPYSAKKLIAHSSEIYEPLDHFLEHYKKHGLKMLAVKPYPVETDNSSSTIFDRPVRLPISGLRRYIRSFYRLLDRLINPSPWFPK